MLSNDGTRMTQIERIDADKKQIRAYPPNPCYLRSGICKQGINAIKFLPTGIFVPPQVLTCSGSKGMISARKGTP